MQRFFKRYFLGLFYVVFLTAAVLFGGREPFFFTESEYAGGKYVLLAIYFCFLVYSLQAARRENFFKSLTMIIKLYWGRQVCLDLYVSVVLSLIFIYMVEDSIGIFMLWILPVLVFANLAILPYLILNYGLIVGYFLP